jgi:L-arabinokinase
MSARHPAFLAPAEAARSAYGRSSVLLRLPFAGDLSAFPRILDLPLIARRPKVDHGEARRRLGLDARPVVLLCFGGVGLPGLEVSALAPLRELMFLSAGEWPGAPANLRSVPASELDALGLGYEDLVRAADVVVTKPGYGIVTDAIAARTRIVYTERGDFAEYPILVEGMSRLLPCVHVSNPDLLAGRLEEPVRRVLALPFPAEPDLGGADVAAARVLELCP